MAKEKLTMLQIKNAPAPSKLMDGGGLIVTKRNSGSVSFSFRYAIKGERTELGLGGLGSMTLKRAREIASDYRLLHVQGINPEIEHKKKNETIAEIVVTKERVYTVEELLKITYEKERLNLKESAAPRWFSPLAIHVIPKIGHIDIEELTQEDVVDMIRPIWKEKHETADKALRRLRMSIKLAKTMKLDVSDDVVNNAKIILGRVVVKPKHIPHMDYAEVPNFYVKIVKDNFVSSLALRLTILTALRSTPIRNAKFSWINYQEKTLIVPKEFMKSTLDKAEDFVVPLCDESFRVIEACRPTSKRDYLFYGSKGIISDATISDYMKRMNLKARPHGFRTSMRTWLAENRDLPERFEAFEMMLAHEVGGKVERVYKQAKFLEERREYQKLWSNYVISKLDLKAEVA
jgi:integrase